MSEEEKALASSKMMPGPGNVRQYPAYHLVAWQPQGLLEDRLLDEIAEWLCAIEKASAPFKRYIDLSRLTGISVRTRHGLSDVRHYALYLAAAGKIAGRAARLVDRLGG